MNTHDTYKDSAAVFTDYAKEKGINKFYQVDVELCKSFLRHEVEIGKSAWTISVEILIHLFTTDSQEVGSLILLRSADKFSRCKVFGLAATLLMREKRALGVYYVNGL